MKDTVTPGTVSSRRESSGESWGAYGHELEPITQVAGILGGDDSVGILSEEIEKFM